MILSKQLPLRSALATGLLVTLCTASATAATGDDTPWFEEVALASGLDWTYQSGATDEHWFPEIMGGGGAFLDYDGDGLLDVYLIQSGSLKAETGANPPNKLFRNLGDGQFEDVTETAGVGHTGYGMGVACGDYDQDGDIDIYVTNVGPNVLYRNEGDGKFSDVTSAMGVGHAGWGTSCAFVDYDGDDDLDLYVVNNLLWSPNIEIECRNYYQEPDYCSPNNYNASAPDVFYRYGGLRGKLAYSNATKLAGLDVGFGNGLGLACGDFNLDSKVDIYVANDATPNQLWMSRGGNSFEDKGLAKGCAVNGNGTPEAGMGVQAVDIDHDGDLDLFMTHLRKESNTLYRNRSGYFSDKTSMTGMLGSSLNVTGFGMGFHDFDHDGTLDLYVANGAVQAWKGGERFDENDAYAEPNHLYSGTLGLKFNLVEPAGGTAEPMIATSRGAAFGDYDNDGDVDILIIDRDANVKLLRNVKAKTGHWAGVRLLNKGGNDALGATMRASLGTTQMWRHLDTAYSYLCSNDARVHFGLGAAEMIDELLVRWPAGGEELFGPLKADEYHTLKKGSGRPVADK